MVEVIGTILTAKGREGDFQWMIHQPQYNDALFLFNDNEEYHYTSRKGRGNAIVRCFNKHSKHPIPRAAGIPTGTRSDGGYETLSEHNQAGFGFCPLWRVLLGVS